MFDSIIKNWTTSLPALLILLCATSELANILPDGWYIKLMAVCGILTALGLFAAKSANVTHSVESAAPRIVNPVP